MHEIFRKTAGKLFWVSKEEEFAAGILSPGLALIASAAGNCRLYGNSLAGLHPLHLVSHTLYNAGSLVPDDKGKLNNLRSDSAGGVVVDIRSANADGFYFDEHVVFILQLRDRLIYNFKLLDSSKLRYFQGDAS